MGNGDLSRIRLNSKGMDNILGSPAVVSKLRADAARVAAAARAAAPVDTGEYRDSIQVEVTRPHDRQVARVVARSPHALLVERDTSNLAKALAASVGRSRLNR